MSRHKLPPAWENEFSFVEPMHRFINSVEVNDNECWIWTKSVDINGYGQFSIRGNMLKAHRFIYEIYNNKVKEGKELDHLCRVRSCVNPDHLEEVTHAENMRRYIEAMTSCRAGHEYNEENCKIYINKQGYKIRYCRVCDRIRRRNARKKIHETITVS